MDKESKFVSVMKQEVEQMKKQRNKFYNDPIHWSNNKRRRNGLSVLRGDVNRYRSKTFQFYITVAMLNAFENLVDCHIEDNIGKLFDSFIDIKKVSFGEYINVTSEVK